VDAHPSRAATDWLNLADREMSTDNSTEQATSTDLAQPNGISEESSEKKRSPRLGRFRGLRDRFDAYTIMLGISLFAICVAIALLYLQLASYGSFPWWKTS
jgi:hypothetical protein